MFVLISVYDKFLNHLTKKQIERLSRNKGVTVEKVGDYYNFITDDTLKTDNLLSNNFGLDPLDFPEIK